MGEGKTVIEFRKDDKMTITTTVKGKELKIDCTYKVEGNKLTVTSKPGEEVIVQTRTISKLTDTEMVSADEKGKEDTLVRMKDK